MGMWPEGQCEPWKGLQQGIGSRFDCSSSQCCLDSGPEFTLGNTFRATNARGDRARRGDLYQQRRKDSRFGSPLVPSLLDFRALVPAGGAGRREGQRDRSCSSSHPRAMKPGLISDRRAPPHLLRRRQVQGPQSSLGATRAPTPPWASFLSFPQMPCASLGAGCRGSHEIHPL